MAVRMQTMPAWHTAVHNERTIPSALCDAQHGANTNLTAAASNTIMWKGNKEEEKLVKEVLHPH